LRQITVDLGPRSYAVLVGAGLVGGVGPECARLGLGRRVAVVTQRAVGAHAARVVESLRGARFSPAVIEVPQGEAAKSPDEARRLWDAFLHHGLDRGIAYVQVPTTLLAQVDASVGGKVAVNHPGAKNLIGAFHQPRLVVIDPATLGTLPEREYRSGLAEVVKTGAALNADLFASLEESASLLGRRDAAVLETVVASCCAEKATIVEQDEREETGLRMVLNYGHTIGHALETLGGYETWRHGEAVSVGIAAAARLSVRLGLTDPGVAARQVALLEAVGLPTRFGAPAPREVLETLRRDKKARDGRVVFVLLKALGRAEVSTDVPSELVLEVLEEVHGGPTPVGGQQRG